MALPQHSSISVRFDQQYENAKAYLIPFLEEAGPLTPGMKVLEIGCGEGGVLKPFAERDIYSVGVDLSAKRIESANSLMESFVQRDKALFIAQNVYEDTFLEKWQGQFDWILLKDTIEHIPEQERFIPYLNKFLKPGGKIFLGFPPWYMPFGGHQQICKSKISKLPYLHLLPRSLYKGIVQAAGEAPRTVQELMEIKDTGISIERFERIVSQSPFSLKHKRFYLFNPIYKYKFGLQPRLQYSWISALPYLRNYLTTAVWYIIAPN